MRLFLTRSLSVSLPLTVCATHLIKDCFINITRCNVACKDAVFEEWNSMSAAKRGKSLKGAASIKLDFFFFFKSVFIQGNLCIGITPISDKKYFHRFFFRGKILIDSFYTTHFCQI